MTGKIKITLTLLLLFISVSILRAQTGVLKGKITNFDTNEPLIGASVSIEGTTIGTIADLNGDFILKNLPAGKHSFRAGFVSYEPIIVQLEIKDKQVVEYDFQLIEKQVELESVQITAKASRENENVLLAEQKQAVLQTQTIGAKELSRKGVGDAKDAIAKVSGISKQEGVKNVFVRGLGDRYNATTLNGFPIPSEDPEYKNISLDFFSTDVIQYIGVNKVFTSSFVSDVGGAIIDIQSKELTEDAVLDISISGGINTQTYGNEFIKADGVNALGFANSSQPTYVNSFNYDNKLNPTIKPVIIDNSFSISGGKKFEFGGKNNDLSVFFTLNNSNDYFYSKEYSKNTTTTGHVVQDIVGEKSTAKTSQLGLANLVYNMNNKHRLIYNFMFVHTNNQYVSDYIGIFERIDDTDGFFRRQQSNDNRLFINQLISSWQLSPKFQFDLGFSYNNITGLEPDRRVNGFKRISDSTNAYVLLLDKNNIRYYSTLKENDYNIQTSLKYKINDNFDNASYVKIGYIGRFVKDGFEAVEYNIAPYPGQSPIYNIDNFSLDDFYNQEGYEAGKFMHEISSKDYSVKKLLHSTYVESTYQFARKLHVNAGVKFDMVDMSIIYDLSGIGVDVKPDKIVKNYILPSLNLKYTLDSRNSLRLSLSKTYTLPQAKEISPFKYVNINFESMGYDKLKPSDNYNADLKWEFYPTISELISVTTFYKHITRPISRISVGSAAGMLSYRNIAKYAAVAGVEFEMRKNIFTFTRESRLNRLSAGLNASYIYTNAKVSQAKEVTDEYGVPNPTVTTGSPLEGAAPIIVNFDISHQIYTEKGNFINTLVLNYISDRVHTIGTEGHKDIMEKGIATLDFISSVALSNNFSINLKAKNLLNPEFQLYKNTNITNEDVVLSSYKKGVSFSLGLSYKL